MQADGYSLDDKRNELDASKHENNNIPDIVARFKDLEGALLHKYLTLKFYYVYFLLKFNKNIKNQ